MIWLQVGQERIAIPGEQLMPAVRGAFPAWLLGEGDATPKQRAARSALNAVIPLLLALQHQEHSATIPAPNLRDPAARKNMIVYFLNYLISNFAQRAEGYTFYLTGERIDHDALVISGITTTPPELATPPTGDGSGQPVS